MILGAPVTVLAPGMGRPRAVGLCSRIPPAAWATPIGGCREIVFVGEVDVAREAPPSPGIFCTITVLLPPPGVAIVNCCSLSAAPSGVFWSSGGSLPGVCRSFS